MVETWEVEWNSSMLEHGRDLGTMEFVIAKGGTTSDVNYVMFDVQDNTWEPLIKAIAERDNSHPDIIRKNVQQAMPQRHQEPFAAPGAFGRMRPAQSQDGTFATSPREARKNFKTGQTIDALAQYRKDPTAMNAMRAGLYGQAAGRGAMAAGRAAKDFATSDAGKAAGRRGLGMGLGAGLGALVAGPLGAAAGGALGGALAKPGVGKRMKNFMGKVGQRLSDLRHLPAAAKQSLADRRARTEDNERREALEAGLGRAQTDMDAASRRAGGPGAQFYDDEMDRASGSINQGLARDYNINIPTNDEGKPTMSAQDAMREEIKQIGERRAKPTEGFFAGMKRRGDERRAKAEAERTGAAYADSNIAPQTEAEEEEAPAKLAEAPSQAAKEAANADAPPPDEQLPSLPAEKDETQLPSIPSEEQLPSLETDAPPNTGVVNPQPSQKAIDAMAIMDNIQANKRERLAMEGGGETATATEPTAGQRFASEAGMKLGATSGDRVASGLDKIMEQHGKTPFADREAAMQAMLQGNIGTSRMTEAGKFGGKTAKAVEAALAQMFGPAQAKQIVQAAEQGNPEAQEIVQDAEEQLPSIDMELSEDKHQQDWDYLMKQMNLR